MSDAPDRQPSQPLEPLRIDPDLFYERQWLIDKFQISDHTLRSWMDHGLERVDMGGRRTWFRGTELLEFCVPRSVRQKGNPMTEPDPVSQPQPVIPFSDQTPLSQSEFEVLLVQVLKDSRMSEAEKLALRQFLKFRLYAGQVAAALLTCGDVIRLDLDHGLSEISSQLEVLREILDSALPVQNRPDANLLRRYPEEATRPDGTPLSKEDAV